LRSKKVFRKITHKCRSFHLGGYYCGSLSKSVRISHDLETIFPRVPIKDNRLSEGIEIDTLHFRRLVGKTMANKLNIHQLPLSFKYFFSENFIDIIKSANIQIVKDYSFLQMFHIVFFDSTKLTNFVHLVIQYWMTNETAFIANLNLGI
jgi:hypothetical protein